MGTQEEIRPAWYALGAGGWREYVTLLHPPYTLWHLSYVAVGAALAPHFHTDRMVWGIASFFLAMGVAAHALDELRGRPLRTHIPSAVLVALAVGSLAGAVAIGVGASIAWGYGLLVFVAIGAVLVPAYNLELAFHNDLGFALAWGAFPALTGFFVEAQTIRIEAVAAAAYAFTLSIAQRTLSTPVRRARRAEETTVGIAPLERALRLLTWTSVALAVALVAARLR
ncbi:MAG TPA: hypothetical protein VFJ93_11785 [Gaiellaceae bacterium]|nr:hypothetical protein [Gaiellaceae bacterium]